MTAQLAVSEELRKTSFQKPQQNDGSFLKNREKHSKVFLDETDFYAFFFGILMVEYYYYENVLLNQKFLEDVNRTVTWRIYPTVVHIFT